ncbi:MAG TPA: CPBP family intramembrane glutamic endopeptidase, partial [Steroidobacteraceae bacterium]|nr:CPBP family intramembrane glutamic endopeptidase [Steroidobacteraceae bacterium]
MNPIALRWRGLADAIRAKVGDSRAVSACELALGAAIVIGHNVFKVVPNEVPILFVLGLLSMRLRDGGWSAIGFKRPDSWRKLVLIALAAAALRIVLGDLVIDEVTSRFWPEPKAPAGVNELAGNWRLALLYLGIVWTFAAFGEEIAYRGYLMQRAADVGGRTMIAWWISVIAIAILFGYGHYYKGPAGILDSGLAGVILGAAFLLSGRNLWACVLAHGFIDT